MVHYYAKYFLFFLFSFLRTCSANPVNERLSGECLFLREWHKMSMDNLCSKFGLFCYLGFLFKIEICAKFNNRDLKYKKHIY